MRSIFFRPLSWRASIVILRGAGPLELSPVIWPVRASRYMTKVAADTAHHRFHNPEHCIGGNSRVYCASALREDHRAGLRRKDLTGSNDPATSNHHRSAVDTVSLLGAQKAGASERSGKKSRRRIIKSICLRRPLVYTELASLRFLRPVRTSAPRCVLKSTE